MVEAVLSVAISNSWSALIDISIVKKSLVFIITGKFRPTKTSKQLKPVTERSRLVKFTVTGLWSDNWMKEPKFTA